MLVHWNYVALLEWHLCSIPDDKDMSGKRYGVAVRRPIVKCMKVAKDIISTHMDVARSLKEIRKFESSLLENPSNSIAVV